MVLRVKNAFSGNPRCKRGLLGIDDALTAMGLGGSNGSTQPAAYLNYIVFDRNFTFIDGSFITSVDNNQGVMQQFSINDIPTITKPGYVCVYLSNESDVTTHLILFDELNIHLTRPIEQVQDYYPFGLTMAGTSYQRLGTQENKFKYNGKEIQDDLDLNWYDYGVRMYDPAIGRWWVVDPLAEKWNQYSPYNYAINNPLLYIDPDCEDVIDANGNVVQIEINENEDGRYVANYTFAEGTSEDVQNSFMDNAGRFINEAIQIETGREYVNAAIDSDEKLNYEISTDESYDANGDLRLGTTQDQRGDNGEISHTNITIFEGSINLASQAGNQLYELTNLSQDQKVAVTGIHETHHATNPTDIRIRRIERRPFTPAEHAPAYRAGTISAIEFGELNNAFDD